MYKVYIYLRKKETKQKDDLFCKKMIFSICLFCPFIGRKLDYHHLVNFRFKINDLDGVQQYKGALPLTFKLSCDNVEKRSSFYRVKMKRSKR